MKSKDRYKELLKKRKWVRSKLDQARKALDHPHGQWQSAHDLAESDFKVYSALLENIEKEIQEIKGP